MKPLHVLLVDNDPAAADQVGSTLRHCDLEWTGSVTDALARLVVTTYDAVIIDLDQPSAEVGIEGLRNLRAASNTVPIVGFTASGQDQFVATALASGAQECLSKDEADERSLPRCIRYAIERHKLEAALEAAYQRQVAPNSAAQDSLTGLSTAAVVEDRLDATIHEAIRFRRALTISLWDVDQLHRINSRYGHAVGDAALKHLATGLQHNLRRSDYVARYANDEFLVVMPGTGPSAAMIGLRRLRAHLVAQPLELHDSRRLHISTAVGAIALTGLESAHQLIEGARSALVDAQRKGRGQLVMHGTSAALAGPI